MGISILVMVKPTLEATSVFTAAPGCAPLVLASTSPRRRELIALTGWPITLRPVEIDETPMPGESAPAMTRRLAAAKARAARSAASNAAVVLAADTVVVDGDELLGKPRDDEEARRMLRRLRGRTHQVITSLVVIAADGSSLFEDTCSTDVPMREYSDAEVESFVSSGGPRDKAGGYAIQDPLFEPVDVTALDGCFANVMGLPLCHVVRTLRRLGVEPVHDVPARCQAHTGYVCPVYERVLSREERGTQSPRRGET
jgi:septum formation protein